MQLNSLVSVICLCYNHEKFVIESLESVLQQDYPFIELIIVDDGSSDHSVAVIKNWLRNHPQIPFIVNSHNIGNTKSFNKALLVAKGDYIIDLAADDVLLPNCIRLQLKKFQESSYKNLGIVYGNAEVITEDGHFDSHFFPTDEQHKTLEKRPSGDIYLSVLSGGNCICSVSAMIRRTVFDHIGVYDENLAYEDLDFWIRTSRVYEFDFIDEVLIQKRITTNSLGSHFGLKHNANAKKINHSTYLILKKAIALNRNSREDAAIQKRIQHQIKHSLKIMDIDLFFNIIGLQLLLIKRRF